MTLTKDQLVRNLKAKIALAYQYADNPPDNSMEYWDGYADALESSLGLVLMLDERAGA